MVNRTALIFSLWKYYLFFAVFGAVSNNIINSFGLPNLFTAVRTVLLVSIFFLTPKRLKGRNLALFTVFFILFVVFYLSVSIFQGKFGMGLYYIRLYVEPILVLFLARLFINKIDYSIIRFIRILAIASVITSLISLGSYYLNLPVIRYFHGNNEINHNWFLAGVFIYRTGFPIGGPNQLGLLFSSFIMINTIHPVKDRKRNIYYTGFLLIGLLFTFSKSAILALFVFFILHSISYNSFHRLIPRLLMSLVLFSIILYLLDQSLFEGYLLKYLTNFSRNEDLSTAGHLDSIVNAVHSFKEYYFYGYEKGTVGPKASQFTTDYRNVESSIFILLYDMGLVVLVPYLVSIGSLFMGASINKKQLCYLAAVLTPFLFLPLIHSLEITAVLFFMAIVAEKKWDEGQNNSNVVVYDNNHMRNL